MADERSLTLLHVSDMQFGRHHQFPQDTEAPPNEFDTLLERIWDDIDALRKSEGLQPDLLVCTGDLAEWAWPTEFADAFRFLDSLAKKLGLGRDRVITIPGNHDVHRKECLRYFERCVESGETIVPPWFPKWQQYAAAFGEFYKYVPGVRFTPDEPWSLFEIPELEVVVAGLNSTFVDGPDWPTDGSLPNLPDNLRPKHAGWCGEKQLRWFAEKLGSPEYHGWLHVGAVHHNLERGARTDDENLRDSEDFERVLGSHLHLVMHGHTHRARFGQVRDKFPWFATGSAGLKQDIRPYGVPNQYQFLILNPEGVRIRARFYMPDEKEWADETRYKQAYRAGIKEVSHSWRDVRRLIPPVPAFAQAATKGWDKGLSDDLDEAFERRVFRPSKFKESESPIRPDDFLSTVAECCRLRFPPVRDGGAAHSIEEIRPSDRSTPYLRVSCRDGGIVQQYPVGATRDRPTREVLTQFAEEVLAQYRAAAPRTMGEFVFGGGLVAGDELRHHAATCGLRLRSLLEYQGLIDFAPYLEKQNARLAQDDIYPPHLYVPQRMGFEAGAQRASTDAALDQVSAWLVEPDPRFILILGEFGTGKTFLLRQVALRLGQMDAAPVPLLIELRYLEKARKLDELLAQHFARQQFDRFDLTALHYMMRQGRVVLLFDGFDELALRVGYAQAAEHLDTLIEAAEGDARVVVSCRTSYFENDRQIRLALGRHVERVRGLRWCRLQPFDRSQIFSFLLHRFGSEAEAHAWQRLLQEVHDLLGLGENPRMLSFICQLQREQLEEAERRTGSISAAELYRILLLKHWLGYEITRRFPRGVPVILSAEQWLDPATVLALALWTRTDRWLALDELRQAVRDALERYAPDKLNAVEEAVHVLGDGTLFIRDEDGRFSFVHQSVMEWLVARRIAEELTERNVRSLLGFHALSPLMAEFLCALNLDGCRWWIERNWFGEAPESDAFDKNTLQLREWLGSAGLKRVEMPGADLRGQDLTKLDLRGANLRDADLREALLSNCDLSGADLTGANLVKAVCDGAKFVGAKLDGVQAEGCSAMGADFTGATMAEGKWRRARLLAAALTGEQAQEMELSGAALPDRAGVALRLPASASAYAVAWSPDGTLLATGHHDHTIRILDAGTGLELLACKGHNKSVMAVIWSPNGTRLASGSDDQTVRVWEAQSGRELLVCKGHERPVAAVSWSPDGTRLASGSYDGTVRVWEAHSGRELLACKGHEGYVMAVSWSPDALRLASGSVDRTVRVWEAQSGREVLACKGHERPVAAVSWSPDGTRLVSGSFDHTVRVWEAHSGRELLACKGHGGYVSAVSWSPDGTRLASSSYDQTVRVWEAHRAWELLACTGHSRPVNAVRWSPDGTRLASGSSDWTVRVWEAQSGRELLCYKGYKGELPEISDDGRMRWPPRRPNGEPIPLTESFHGAGLCRFTLEEARRWRPDLFFDDDEPVVS